MSRQWVFNNKNIHKYYISPYADWQVTDGNIIVGRKEKEDRFVLEFNIKQSVELFEKLEEGMEPDELKKAIAVITGDADSSEWLAFFVQEGIIE